MSNLILRHIIRLIFKKYYAAEATIKISDAFHVLTVSQGIGFSGVCKHISA